MTANAYQAWEKVLEYASMPLHGTMSRTIRKGVRLQIGDGKVYENAVLFISDLFLRVTEESPEGESINTYYDINRISSIRTYSRREQ